MAQYKLKKAYSQTAIVSGVANLLPKTFKVGETIEGTLSEDGKKVATTFEGKVPTLNGIVGEIIIFIPIDYFEVKEVNPIVTENKSIKDIVKFKATDYIQAIVILGLLGGCIYGLNKLMKEKQN